MVVDESEEGSQLIFQFKQLERRSLKKNQGFNGIRTRVLRDTGVMLSQSVDRRPVSRRLRVQIGKLTAIIILHFQ